MCKQHSDLKVTIINVSMQNETIVVSQGTGFNSKMTQHVSANYGYSYTDMLGFFFSHLLFIYYYYYYYYFFVSVHTEKLKPVI
jgi:hypothetical protein